MPTGTNRINCDKLCELNQHRIPHSDQ